MKDINVLSLSRIGGGLFPTDTESEEIINSLSKGENVNVILNADRNILMHRAYFSIMSFVWDNLPEKFQSKCPKKHFYKFLKEMQGRFEIIEISAKTQVKEYESLNFSKMGFKRFHEVFKEDLEFIASDILPALDMHDFTEILFTKYELTLTKYRL